MNEDMRNAISDLAKANAKLNIRSDIFKEARKDTSLHRSHTPSFVHTSIGDIGICKVCGCLMSYPTTECCDSRLSAEDIWEIRCHKIDFKDGEWVKTNSEDLKEPTTALDLNVIKPGHEQTSGSAIFKSMKSGSPVTVHANPKHVENVIADISKYIQSPDTLDEVLPIWLKEKDYTEITTIGELNEVLNHSSLITGEVKGEEAMKVIAESSTSIAMNAFHANKKTELAPIDVLTLYQMLGNVICDFGTGLQSIKDSKGRRLTTVRNINDEIVLYFEGDE